MKRRTRITVYAGTLWLSLSILLAPRFLTASAQSGRGVPPLSPTATPTVQPTSPKRSANKDIDADADKYKIVFRTGSQLDGFIELLNKAGEQGYRLKSAINGAQRASAIYYALPVAILQLDEGQYEYAWFRTTSNVRFAINGFEGKYAELSKRGFHLVDHFLDGYGCEYRDSDNSALGQDCEWDHLFLLEREKGVEKPNQFILASIYPSVRKDVAKELTTQINEKQADGYYPTSVFSKYQILLDQTASNDGLAPGNPDVQVVASSFRNDVKKKVNDLAGQGYRLALIDNEAAVMYRYGDTLAPLSYVWLKAGDKRLEQQLATLQESGAVYRMIYRDGDARENQLVFEQGAVGNGQRREYKVLKFEFQIGELLKLKNGAENKVQIELAPSSKEAMTDFNTLVKRGFVVRDLFVSENIWKRISVLLERSRLPHP